MIGGYPVYYDNWELVHIWDSNVKGWYRLDWTNVELADEELPF